MGVRVAQRREAAVERGRYGSGRGRRRRRRRRRRGCDRRLRRLGARRRGLVVDEVSRMGFFRFLGAGAAAGAVSAFTVGAGAGAGAGAGGGAAARARRRAPA